MEGNMEGRSGLSVSAALWTYGGKSVGFARLQWVTFALGYMPALKPASWSCQSSLTKHFTQQVEWVSVKISWEMEEKAPSHAQAELKDLSYQRHLLFLESSLWPPGAWFPSPSSSLGLLSSFTPEAFLQLSMAPPCWVFREQLLL